MVVCKYYRQGNCRYGQYCQFEHINNFGNTKAEYEDEIAVTVAKEVILAEKGGQWLLSCFGPLKERPCIPGMEDLSPEEVRWEIYQAQKNGMVEQAKLHFQQLCQDMKAKREALKNPSRETVTMLKKILGSGQKAPQLGLANNTSTNNVFANKTFAVQNNKPFGSGFFSNNTSSIFGKTNNNPAPVFGGTATFGNNLGGFGTATSSSSIFGGGTTNTSTSFSSVQNNTPAFGAPLQNNSIFGASQSVFAQNNNVFSGTNQLANTPSTSLFNNPMTSQTNNSVFGGATTTTTSLFGGGSSSGLQSNLVFGGAPTTSSSSFSGGIFNQPKTQVPAFGGAPVFGGVSSSYTSNSGNSIFSGQTFGTSTVPTSNIFGATAGTTSTFGTPVSTTTPAFGTSAATTTPAFGATVATTTPVFGTPAATTTSAFGATAAATTTPGFNLNQQSNNNTFGTSVSTSNVFGAQNTNPALSMSNNAPFGTLATAISGPFVTTNSQQFDATSGSSTPFGSAGFGIATSTNTTFGTTATSSSSIFANAGITFATANATVSNSSPFGNVNASLFGSTNATTPATVTANPFAPRMPQNNGPFGSVAQNEVISTSSPFAKSPFNMTAADSIIDDSVYSAEGALTDDEKSMYLAEKFIIGKIPLKPPAKDIR